MQTVAGLRMHGSVFTVQYKGHVLINDADLHVLIFGREILKGSCSGNGVSDTQHSLEMFRTGHKVNFRSNESR